jgi:methyl-accepting chemotaxis protein
VELVTAVSSQINEISDSMREMAGNSQKIIESVSEIKELSENAAANTESVSAITRQQTESMGEINMASRHLAQIAEELQQTINQGFKL